MGRVTAIVAALVVWTMAASAQPAPQTARQALIEMFFSKTPGTFEKHLPETLRGALGKADSGGSSLTQQFSLLTSQLNAQGQLQTFEAGRELVRLENPQTDTKFEILVERDDLRGDEDEIELSFRSYKGGKSQNAPVFPRLTFLMKSDAGTWRLNELTFSIRVSLADPEFAKTILASMQPRPMAASPVQGAMPGPESAAARAPVNDAAAVGAIRTITTAEMAYSATYPGTGFTCSLSDLDGFGAGTPNEHQAMLIESRLASGKKSGYIFTLSGCDGPPASHFQLTAVPAMPGMGLRTFCADQSGAVRYATDGQAAKCLHGGTPLP